MARASRRQQILDVAIDAFRTRGADGTSIGELAMEVGVSKAAVSYHFPTKDELLVALAEPLLRDLEEVVDEAEELIWPDGVRRFLDRYASVLIDHRAVATWIDGDRGVLGHPVLGQRLDRLNVRTRQLLTRPDGVTDVTAASALGALWRPVRNLDDVAPDDTGRLVDAAFAALRDAAR